MPIFPGSSDRCACTCSEFVETERDFVHPSPIMSSALPADVLKVANEGNVKLFGKWESTECVLFVGLGRFRGVKGVVVLVIGEKSILGDEVAVRVDRTTGHQDCRRGGCDAGAGA